MRKTLLVAAILGALVGAALGATWAEIQLVFDYNSIQFFSQPEWLMAAYAGVLLGLAVGTVYVSIQGWRKRLAVVLVAGAILGAMVPFLLAWSPPQGRPLLLAVLGTLLAGASHYWIVVMPFAKRGNSARRRWPQFSLRGMFAAVAVFGVALTIFIRPVQQWRARTALISHGYRIKYEPDGPQWLAWLLGERTRDYFGHVSSVDQSNSRAGGALLKTLTVLPEVEELRLNGSGVDNATLRHLAGLNRLTRLELERTSITDAGLEYLSGIRSLEFLSLANTDITDKGLELLPLAALHELHHLNLAGTKVTDAGLEHLAALPRLKTLNLELCPITGAGLERLADAKSLETLYLRGPLITDAGLRNLAGLSRLRCLELVGTGATEAGLAALEALPELRIISTPFTPVITASGAKKFNDGRERRGLQPVRFYPAPPRPPARK